MRHLHCCGMRLEMIVDPSREDGRFHGHCPRLGKRLHPQVQSQSRGGYRTFSVDTATAVLHAVADRLLVNIQTDVVHSLHGGASLVVSESARSLSSAFLHQALLHDLFIQTIRELCVFARIEMPNITKTFRYNLRTLSLGLSFGGSEDL